MRPAGKRRIKASGLSWATCAANAFPSLEVSAHLPQAAIDQGYDGDRLPRDGRHSGAGKSLLNLVHTESDSPGI